MYKRGAAVVVFLTAVSTIPLSAQAGPVIRPGFGRPGVILGRPFGNGFHRPFPRQSGSPQPIFISGGFYYPFDYVESAQPTSGAPPTVIVIDKRDEQPRPSVAATSAPPVVINLPAAGTKASIREPKRVPTIFVMTNGERIEAERYTLSDTRLIVLVGPRQVRDIPISALNLEATIAVNREHGIEIQVPSGPSEYFLSF